MEFEADNPKITPGKGDILSICLHDGTGIIRRPYDKHIRRTGIPRLFVFYLPSFVDCYSWVVYEQPNGRYYLQTVTWRQSTDYRRIERAVEAKSQSPLTPTIEEKISELDGKWFEQKIATFPALERNVVGSIGCNGKIWGISLPIEVEWWCRPPDELWELGKWVHECVEKFRQLV